MLLKYIFLFSTVNQPPQHYSCIAFEKLKPSILCISYFTARYNIDDDDDDDDDGDDNSHQAEV